MTRQMGVKKQMDVLLVASAARHQQLTARRWFGKNPTAALSHLTPADARQRFKFDHGHPVDGMAYVLNPCVADHYLVPALANERMAQEKLAAFAHIAACLGAKKIELPVEMKTDERQASVQLPSLLAKLGVSGSVTRRPDQDCGGTRRRPRLPREKSSLTW